MPSFDVSSPRVRIAVGFVLLALPLLAQGLFEVQEGSLDMRALFRINDQEAVDVAKQRAQRRALERCHEHQEAGEAVSCPVPAALYDAAPETETAKESDDEKTAVSSTGREAGLRDTLTATELRTLRAYTRAGYCSKAAGDVIYDLCRLQVNVAGGTAPMGIMNDNALLHSARRVFVPVLDRLRVRIQQTSEGLDTGGTIRGGVPLRYEGGLYDRENE